MDLPTLRQDIKALELLLLTRYRDALREHGVVGREVLNIQEDDTAALLQQLTMEELIEFVSCMEGAPLFGLREGVAMTAALRAVRGGSTEDRLKVLRAGIVTTPPKATRSG